MKAGVILDVIVAIDVDTLKGSTLVRWNHSSSTGRIASKNANKISTLESLYAINLKLLQTAASSTCFVG